jgi:hypothetical protein
MRILKTLLVLGLILFTTEIFGQYLPASYEPMLNEIVENFKTIRTGNSLTEGKNSIRVINDNRIVLRLEYKRQIKNLTFETKPDEENNLFWVASNQLTIDMVNKHEDYLTKTLKSMHKLSESKSKE